MIFEIICVIFAIIIIAISINGIGDYYKQNKRVNMSFKEAMDLVELPIVTFYSGDKKLNFLLDTGSNISQINSSILPSIDYKRVEEKNMEVIGIEGNKRDTEFCELTLIYKDQKYVNNFCIHDLDNAFTIIKEESGVQIHGILGSLFFQKYKYVFDFDSLIAFSKRA